MVYDSQLHYHIHIASEQLIWLQNIDIAYMCNYKQTIAC